MSDSIVIVVRGGSPGDALAERLRDALAGADQGARIDSTASESADLTRADAVLALDAGALVAAKLAGIRVRIAVTRGLAARFDGDLEDATHVAIPHAAAMERAGRKAALIVGLASTAHTAALVSEARSPEARAAARQAAGFTPEARVVLVDAAELVEIGLRSVLLQLALTEPLPVVFFDVGEDVALVSALRAELPGHGLDAFVFAGAERAIQLPLADLVLGRASGALVESALAAGLSVLPLPREDAADGTALAVLAAWGVPPPPRSLAVLSVALDASLSGAVAVAPSVAGAALDAAGMASRLVDAARNAVIETRAGRGPRPLGLPLGLERISSRDDTIAPKSAPIDPSSGPDASDPDARIDAELAALKKRL